MLRQVERTFEDRPAVREATPLLVGLVGPSGTGKTFSALRLATGIQRVSGGDIWGIDTEARRMLHYAGRFKFRHTPFGPPFSPLDYLAVINHCVRKGAKTIIIDSMSHEHEGPGGVLEMHETEMERLLKAWTGATYDKVQIPAWALPKAERRRLINSILQMNINFIFCFRAKEKLKIKTGEKPITLGWMPLAGEEFIYEQTLNCLLLPGANGTPSWQPDEIGEKAIIKLPEQFRSLFAQPAQLSEDIGQKLAEWAAGAPARPPPDPADLVKRYATCSDPATLRALEEERGLAWKTSSKEARAQMKAASEAATKRVAETASSTPAPTPEAEEPEGQGPGLEPLPGGTRL